LGLSIVKRLVEMMGGQVGIKSESGKGSSFWFTLPLAAALHESAVTRPLHTGKRVLVVDDNASGRRMLTVHLKHLGHEVTAVQHGAAALQALHAALTMHRHFDVVLANSRLPDMEAAMLGGHIHANPQLAHTRLVLMTAIHRPGDTQRSIVTGVAAHLSKPIRVRELRECLRRLFSSAARTQVNQPQTASIAPQQPAAAARFTGNVLLVDDNAVNQKVAGRLLERMGLTITIASDGAEAVKAYETGAFDMVFMDLQMPVMDGFEATRRIRDFEAWRPRKPIIALTANAMSGQMDRCLASGMDGFLSKPIQVDQLRSIVARYCSGSSIADENKELDGQATATLLETATETPALLNKQRLTETSGGDVRFMRELAKLYIESAWQILADIKAAHASHDRHGLGRAAHKLKGASASIHADRAHGLCKFLEENAMTLDADKLAATLQQLEQAIASLATELGTLLQDDQSVA